MNALILALCAVGQLPDIANDAELMKLCAVETQSAKGKRDRLIVHLLDYHFVPRDAFKADLLSQDAKLTADEINEAYHKHLANVRKVQAQQSAELSHLIANHGIKTVYLEGFTDADRIAIAFVISSLRRTKDRGDTWLRIGAAGQLMVGHKIEAVLPAEDKAAYIAADPTKGKSFKIDENAMHKRRQAIVKRLEQHSIAVVVLGRAHDLSELVGDGTQHVRLSVPALRQIDE